VAEGDRKDFEQELLLGPLSSEGMKQLVRELGLQGAPARNLEVCLQHAEADLEIYVRRTRSRPERKELLGKRQRLRQMLRALYDELKRRGDELGEVLPNASLDAIGLLLDAEEMARVLGKQAPRYLHRRSSPFQRATVGLHHGGRLLTHFIDSVLGPLEDWDEENRANRGGRPHHLRQQFLIRTLARACPDILGLSAAAGGNFTNLCDAVFRAYGLDTDGIRDAIGRELAKLKSGPDLR
jgi:hypothetical protein